MGGTTKTREELQSELAVLRARVAELERAEEALQERERFYSSIFASIQDGISILDSELNIIQVNPMIEQWYSHAMPLIGKKCYEAYHGRSTPCEVCPTRQTLETGRSAYEVVPKTGPGGRVDGWLDLYSFPLYDTSTGRLKGVIEYVRDITERRQVEEEKEKLEARLRHAQKMEAVGQLAGGVAHDFNNLLTAILGNVELLLPMMERGLDESSTETAKSALEQIKFAGQRATALTQQLLAFGRKEMTRAEVLGLDRVVGNTEKMLRRLLREDIVFDVSVAPGTSRIRADAGQIEQVMMNLVLNARDAMPEGGRLTVACSNVDLDEAHAAAYVGARPGPHVMLVVSDTGVGMSRETMDHMFEPFFTTKPTGRGTGLGLATVYGIVRQTGAHVAVESELGKGSIFRVYFPAVEEEAARPEAAAAAEGSRGDEVILVCEDDKLVRRVIGQVLQAAGYTVLEAANGKHALDVAANHDGDIDLLISDVIMPEMNGKELAEAVARRYPRMRVVFVSGYTDDVLNGRVSRSEGNHFLQKPFSSTTLLQRVRGLLDRT